MIRQRFLKNGQKSYEAVLMIKGVKRSKSFSTWTEANVWQNENRFRRDKGADFVPAKKVVTVQNLFDAYLDYAEGSNLSPGTLGAEESRFKVHILPFYGNINLLDVPIEGHRAFIKQLNTNKRRKDKKKLSPIMMRKVKLTMQGMYRVAIEEGLFGNAFEYNPFQNIKTPQFQKKAIQFWNKEQMVKFLSANRKSYYYPLFLFMLRTGTRIGEALGLHACQLDFAGRRVTIDRQFSCKTRKIVFRLKSKKSRTIGLYSDAGEVIKPLAEKYPQGQIFRKEDGSPLFHEYFDTRILKEACENAKLPRINPHSLRHTFAAWYLQEMGGQLQHLSKILGHGSLKITQDFYEHLTKDYVAEKMLELEGEDNVVLANFG